MSLSIINNLAAMNTHRSLARSSDAAAAAMKHLSTGYRINSAADDAAGLGISEKMTGQIKGLDQAQRNIGDGISLVQTAEGNLDEVHNMLQRVRELAVQYNNGTLSTADQAAITGEVAQLSSEIARVGASAQFNSIHLLDGSVATVTFQVGANDGDIITAAMTDVNTAVPAATFALGSATILADIDTAIDNVSAGRAGLGAVQNRLEHTSAVQASYQENLQASESAIKDVDMAAEMTEFTKNNILTQAGTAMLAQANQQPQQVLQLLRQ